MATEKTIEYTRIQPPVDVLESENDFTVIADLPGVEREQVEITVEKGQIQLAAKRAVSERGPVEYMRHFVMPREIDAEQIKATMNQGVLTLVLPKAQAKKPHRIEISVD